MEFVFFKKTDAQPSVVAPVEETGNEKGLAMVSRIIIKGF